MPVPNTFGWDNPPKNLHPTPHKWKECYECNKYSKEKQQQQQKTKQTDK